MGTAGRRIAMWSLLALFSLVVAGLAWRSSRQVAVIVEWTTASELNTAGFNLYRSEAKAGPYTRVNEALLPASPDPLTGGSYEFTDEGVLAGVTYYYQLEEVETNGTSRRYTEETIPVTAQAGGQLELALAGLLFIAALVGLALQFLPRRAHG